MRIKFLFLFLVLIFYKSSAYCQPDSVLISGSIDSTFMKLYNSNELILRLKQTINIYSQGEQFKATIKADGTFEIRIKINTPSVYMAFEMLDNRNNSARKGVLMNINYGYRNWFYEQNEVYLFERGDIINVRILKGGLIRFAGRGSQKLNCQYQMYSINARPESIFYRGSDLVKEGDLLKSLLLGEKSLDLGVEMRLAILDTYKGQISESAFKCLYLDAIASAFYPTLFQFFSYSYARPQQLSAKIVREYYDSFLKRDLFPQLDSNYLVKSAYYADFLFMREFNFFRVNSRNGTYYKGDSFKDIYEKLKNDYTGKLRDKLFFICFQMLGKVYSADMRLLIDEAISIVEDPAYKKLLTIIKSKEENAYPFELQDIEGKVHKLSDYKGKVIVIDFWFTGCVPCMELNSAMKPLMKKFEKNSDVQFISVSVDADRNRWIGSVLTNNYTSPEATNLYTNGLGQNHPIIQFHNFNSYPRQLVIGKYGEIITSNPPDVRYISALEDVNSSPERRYSIKNTNKFAEIIDNYLNSSR